MDIVSGERYRPGAPAAAGAQMITRVHFGAHVAPRRLCRGDDPD
jgi:hypothetical protein